MSTQKSKSSKPEKAMSPAENKNLSAHIEKYQEMHKLVRNRARFLEVLEKLNSLEFVDQKEFFNNDYGTTVKWQLLNGRDIVFSISAPTILADVQEFFTNKILQEIANIDSKLLA